MKIVFDSSDDCISSSSNSSATEVGDDKQTIINEYEKKVNEMEDPNALDFLPLCVANIPLEDKVRVLNKLPDAAYSNVEGMEWLEMQLERAGQGSLAQYMRYWLNYSAYEDDKTENNWCQSVIETDSLMRWIVQRQGYVEEQMEGQRRALRWTRGRAETGLVIAEKLAVWEREVIELKKRRWNCKRKQWRLVCDMPYGPVGRAFTALRKDRGWYLSDWLRRDCAGRGGCCGREAVGAATCRGVEASMALSRIMDTVPRHAAAAFAIAGSRGRANSMI